MTEDDSTKSIGEAVSVLPEDAIEDYWTKVVEALEKVFKKSSPEAKDMVRTLQRRIAEEGVSAEIAIYHVDPFQVAADLGGARDRPVTPQEKQAYARIAWNPTQMDRPDEALLKREVPDDIVV